MRVRLSTDRSICQLPERLEIMQLGLEEQPEEGLNLKGEAIFSTMDLAASICLRKSVPH